MFPSILSLYSHAKVNIILYLFSKIDQHLTIVSILGKWWGPRNKQPILTLHGWQDNAGSFDRLCPLMLDNNENLAILCIDLPGHGKSSHYPEGMQYYLFWDGIALIRRIVKNHGWGKMTLMGHSLGGSLTFMYAASFPNDVEKLINIDIAGPTVRSQHKHAEATGFAIDKYLQYENLPESKLPCYTYDEMIDLVLDAYDGSVDLPSVKILMERGMSSAPSHLKKDGYHFSRDLRLKISLLGMFTEEQVLIYAERIQCKVLNIRAEPGMKFERFDVYENVIERLRKNASLLVFEKVPGTHHIHLVTPERIIDHVNSFLDL